MEKPKVTAKDFFLWTGAIIALYASVIAFIALVFSYLNYAFPDVLSFAPINPYQSGIASQMSVLIVMGIIFLVIMRVIRCDLRAHPQKSELWVRRWALVFTLFLAALTIAVDLIVLLTSFLNGTELTERFIFKVLLVLLVAAALFMHFIADLWGYWQKFPERARSVSYATGLLIIIAIAAGFLILGSPYDARLYQYDTQKVSDLQTIQSEIFSYREQQGKLPVALADLSTLGYQALVDPQTNLAYFYRALSPNSFELCSSFNASSTATSARGSYPAVYPAGAVAISNDWSHGSGEVCFERSVGTSTNAK